MAWPPKAAGALPRGRPASRSPRPGISPAAVRARAAPGRARIPPAPGCLQSRACRRAHSRCLRPIRRRRGRGPGRAWPVPRRTRPSRPPVLPARSIEWRCTRPWPHWRPETGARIRNRPARRRCLPARRCARSAPGPTDRAPTRRRPRRPAGRSWYRRRHPTPSRHRCRQCLRKETSARAPAPAVRRPGACAKRPHPGRGLRPVPRLPGCRAGYPQKWQASCPLRLPPPAFRSRDGRA